VGLITSGSATTTGKNMDELPAKKSLGQHWLRDAESLKAIVKAADVNNDDTVLEIGPGLGTLTEYLVKSARKVIAVELDEVLASRLLSQISSNNLIVRQQDIMRFDFGELPPEYKVVANIPYYLTGGILRLFTETNSPPEIMVLLLQKEVAERLAAKPGNLSIVAIAAQLNYEVKLSKIVPADKFTPAPKVDSQVVIFKKRNAPLFKNLDKRTFMRVVKAGFSAKRKKLRSSLSAGLAMDKAQVDELLKKAKINGDLRAQNLSLQDWHKLYNAVQ
jgi:16S rRNA (adenine1518-N6/adenine1519-N6)-dimethyltransferase